MLQQHAPFWTIRRRQNIDSSCCLTILLFHPNKNSCRYQGESLTKILLYDFKLPRRCQNSKINFICTCCPTSRASLWCADRLNELKIEKNKKKTTVSCVWWCCDVCRSRENKSGAARLKTAIINRLETVSSLHAFYKSSANPRPNQKIWFSLNEKIIMQHVIEERWKEHDLET